jgi:SAM-dependent methyltransferase
VIGLNEAARYNAAWATGQYKPLVGLFYTSTLYKQGYFNGYKRLLDVGCGTGAAVRYHREIGGLEAYGFDFAQPAMDVWRNHEVDRYCVVGSAEDIPFRSDSFDIVTCTDVFEHIPEENVPAVLREMYRVGNNHFFFAIALKAAYEKMPHDGSEPHICVKTPEWWVGQMGRAGFRFRRDPYVTNVLIVDARKGSGLIVPNANQYRRYKPLQ